MSLWKFAIVLILGVGALGAGLLVLRGQEGLTLERIAGPRLPVADALAGDGPARNTPADERPEGLPAPKVSATATLAYGNGPGTPPPEPKLYAQRQAVDPDQLSQYRAALESITVIGCSGARIALKIAGDQSPRTIQSGSLLHLSTGLELSARLKDPGRCRVVLSDHGRAIGEVASF